MTRPHPALLALLLCCTALLWRLVHPTGEIATDLLFGWWSYLARVLPQVQIRWDGIAIAVVALTASGLLLHSCCRWLAGAGLRQRLWRLKHSLAVLGLMLLVFVAGISVIGSVHQVVWITGSDEPLFGRQMSHVSLDQRISLRLIGGALHGLDDVSAGLPTAGWYEQRQTSPHSWATMILPYLSYQSTGLHSDLPWTDSQNQPFFRRIVPELLNPGFRHTQLRNDEGYGVSHMAGNRFIFESAETVRLSDFDGQSTILIGEVRNDFAAWGDPRNNRDPRLPLNSPGGFGGASQATTVFLMVDGSCREIPTEVDPGVIQALSGAVARNEETVRSDSGD